ncbi:MAG TPA: methyl-accepting chemotaxis protein [Bdellovibrionota bacterium]|nr:methyl-accepting chemotaxis protein [Bdellovibrionota bacterium]
MLSKLTLNQRILAICSLFSIIVLLVGIAGVSSVTRVSKDYGRVISVTLSKKAIVDDMLTHFFQVRLALRGIGVDNFSREEKQREAANAVTAIHDFIEAKQAYANLESSPGERKLLDAITQEWQTYEKEVANKSAELVRNETPESHAQLEVVLFKVAPGIGLRVAAAIEALSEFQQTEANEWVASADKSRKWLQVFGIILVVLATLIVIFIGFFLSKTLTNSLQSILDRMSRVSHEVNNSALMVYDSADTLSSGVIQQSASLQQTAAAGNELSAMVKNNADNAEKAKTVSAQSDEAAKRGQHAVEETIQAIHEIDATNKTMTQEIEKNNDEISSIVKVIGEIGEKTKIINDIVFQTKLLSFNASVEAARAGEQGKGFAVVAEEVGNLAQMSGNAAKEIADMLQGSIQKVNDIVNRSRTNVQSLVVSGKQKVEAGIHVAQRCGGVLTEVVQNASSVKGTVGEIAVATREQANGLEEISKAVGELEKTNQENSGIAHSVSSATMELAKQSDDQRALIGEMMQMVHGSRKLLQSLDFDAALSAHLSWKFRLAKYLLNPNGSLKPEMAEKDDTCILGKWLSGQGAKYSAEPSHLALRQAHHEFHQLLGKIIRAADANDKAGAHDLLSTHGEFGRISRELVEAVNKMAEIVAKG